MASTEESDFPCHITISTPFPNARLASTALRALQVDEELSPLVRRSFRLARKASSLPDDRDHSATTNGAGTASSTTSLPSPDPDPDPDPDRELNLPRQQGRDEDVAVAVDPAFTVLRTRYRATTNRMLRVSVNGFLDSLALVLHVMEELDADVLLDREERHGRAADSAASSSSSSS